MQIAFYAPMKSPEHPRPSGDRRIAQLLLRALVLAGHQVELASEYRSYEGVGNSAVQSAIKREGENQASALLNAYHYGNITRPDIWFTYHLYHKAPDWIGPLVCEALEIPYIIAEASYAPKQSGGPWDQGLKASKRGIEMASAVISFNAVDDGCVSPLLKDSTKITIIPPFIDTQLYIDAAKEKMHHRAVIAKQYNIASDLPWLICVAMMRPGDKLRSYEQLGLALSKLQDRPWQLLVVGDGSAREQVKLALADVDNRVHWIGAQNDDVLPGIYAACDLYVWPAVNEAFGMAFLEAQAARLVVIAGNSRGVSGVVNAPDCGLLVESENPEDLATAIAKLFDEPQNCQTMASRAQQYTSQHHSLDGGASALTRVLNEVAQCRS